MRQKNYRNLHLAKILVIFTKWTILLFLVNSENNEITLRSYFESEMAEIECKITSHSTVNSILTQYLDQSLLERSKDSLIFWEANRSVSLELYEVNVK